MGFLSRLLGGRGQAAPVHAPAPVELDQIPRVGREASEFSERFWATRESENPAFVEGYWNSRLLPAHEEIANAVARTGARTVIEIGAHCGPNLWAMDHVRPFDKLVGVDISEHVVAAGRKLLSDSVKSPHELLLVNGEKLPFNDNSFDVALSSVVLSCIGPCKIMSVLSEMCRVTRRFVVLAEPYSNDPDMATAEGKVDPYPNTTYWVRNYAGLINKIVPGSKESTVEHLERENWQGHLNSVQTIRLNK